MENSSFKPEIVKGLKLYGKIVECVEKIHPKTMFEIGSANGMGSTRAFIDGVYSLYEKGMLGGFPEMVCTEIYADRFKELRKNVEPYRWITPIHASTVNLQSYMKYDDVSNFLVDNSRMNISKYPATTVHKWRMDEIHYILNNDIKTNGIEQAKEILGKDIDIVFIDGSAFTGSAELEAVYGAKCIILDDTMDIKNYANYRKLDFDLHYQHFASDDDERNGWAIYMKGNGNG